MCRGARRLSATQRGRTVPSPAAAARRRIASPKTTSARPTPRWVTTTRPARGPRRPGEDRLAERRRRVRVAVELAGVAVGEELAAVVDEEQGGVAGDLGGAVSSRSRPATTSASGASQSLVMRLAAGRGRNDAAVTTTSASAVASRAVGATRDRRRCPASRAAAVGQRRGARPDRGRGSRASTPGQHVPEDREVAVALDAGADERGPRRAAGDARREPARSPRPRPRPSAGR